MFRPVLALAVLALAAHAAQWTVVHPRYATILMGIDCADNSTCYMSGGVNGGSKGGAQVWRTDNFGQTFDFVPHKDPAMMFLDIASQTHKNNAAVTGIGMLDIFEATHYTLDGKQFNATSPSGDLVTQTQSIERVVGTRAGFGITGEFESLSSNVMLNGVAVSMDGGANFKKFAATLNTTARYGAFPSPNVWYIAAGMWPTHASNKKQPGVRQLTNRIAVEYNEFAAAEGSKTNMRTIFDLSESKPASNADSWSAAIATTKDGGRTWRQVFWDDTFYFNQISCPTENKCWAVGESDFGARPGVRIWHTADGGNTWVEQLYINKPTHSFIAMTMIDEQEGWAGGGNMAQDFYSVIYHTTNGGQTWELVDPIVGYYVNSFGFTPKFPRGGYGGLATAFDRSGESGILAYN